MGGTLLDESPEGKKRAIVDAYSKQAAAMRAAWDRIHGYGEKDGGKLK